MKKGFVILCLLATVSLVLAHPHFRKTVSTKVGENDVQISYTTTPANMDRLSGVVTGAFNPGYGTLSLSADHSVGGTTLKAGEYTIGAIKNGEDDWTMALHEGRIPRGQQPDMSKVIKLDSMFSKSEGTAHHVFFDIMPGHGKFEGKTVLIWHFGELFLAGSLD